MKAKEYETGTRERKKEEKKTPEDQSLERIAGHRLRGISRAISFL